MSEAPISDDISNAQEISEAERRVQPVVDRLRELDLAEIGTRLDSQHEQDPTVGIVIINLDEVEAIKVDDREYHFHAASFTTGAVVPHYHPHKGELEGQEKVTGPDDEPYIFITDAEMNTAPVEDGQIGPWKTEMVKAGEVRVIKPNVAHSARNGKIGFACSGDHLKDYDKETNPQGNRVLVAKKGPDGKIQPLKPNGVPPHFAQNNL